MNIVVYGDSLAGDTGGQTPVATHLQALRPTDTVTYVSFGALQLANALDNGSGSGFLQAVHNALYNPARYNVVANFSIAHGDVQDLDDTVPVIYDRYRSLIQLEQGLGWYPFAIGVPGTSEYNDPGGGRYRRPERDGFNDMLRNGDGGTRPPRAGAPYYVDTETMVGYRTADLPLSGNGDPVYFINDTPAFGAIHWTSYGYSLMAAQIHGALG